MQTSSAFVCLNCKNFEISEMFVHNYETENGAALELIQTNDDLSPKLVLKL